METLAQETPATTQEYQDREAIKTLRYQFSQALDTNNWPLLESLLKEEIDIDYQSFGVTARRATKAEFSGYFKAWYKREGLRKQHLITNMTVSVQGNQATATSYLLGQYYLPGFAGGEEFIARGHYRDRFERVDGKWLFSAIDIQVYYYTGNAGLVS